VAARNLSLMRSLALLRFELQRWGREGQKLAVQKPAQCLSGYRSSDRVAGLGDPDLQNTAAAPPALPLRQVTYTLSFPPPGNPLNIKNPA
jgi:hypothetical protein